jgi:hypothetical protein
MAYLQSERLQQKVDSMNKILHRTKPRDASEITYINQARAGSVERPSTVTGVIEFNGLAYDTLIQGKGTNMEYGNVLLRSQYAAVSADPNPALSENAVIVLPGVSTPVISSFYTAPCRIPGYQVFLKAPIIDGKNCALNRQVYSSG